MISESNLLARLRRRSLGRDRHFGSSRVGSRALTRRQTRVRSLRSKRENLVLVRAIGYFSRTKQDLFIQLIYSSFPIRFEIF